MTEFIMATNVDYDFAALNACKHTNLVGKYGTIKSIDGKRYISIDHKLYKYLSPDNQDVELGDKFQVKLVKDDFVII